MYDGLGNSDNAAVIQGSVYSVRAVSDGQDTVYSASDILGVLGIKFPLRWISQNRKKHSDEFKTKKLPYPMMTTSGRRYIHMIFVDEVVVEWIIKSLPATKEAKEWIKKEVLTYKIEQPEIFDTKENGNELLEAEANQAAETAEKCEQTLEMDDNLDTMIDRILFDIVELKKLVANRNLA